MDSGDIIIKCVVIVFILLGPNYCNQLMDKINIIQFMLCMVLDTISAKDKQNHPRPILVLLTMWHAHWESESLPKL